MTADDKSHAFGSATCDTVSTQDQRRERQPWHAPVIRIFPASEAETGVNSTTDENAAFS